MRRALEIGGLVAGAVLIVFGIVAIVMGVNGRSTVNTELKQEQVVGTPDMTPAGIKAEAQKAGVNATPSFVIGTQVIAGAYPYANFKSVLDPLLK